MAVSYKKLWKLLIDRDMTKTMLRKEAGITTAALAKLGKNENVNTEVLVKICNTLKCDISDIMKSRTNQQQLKSDFILYLNGFSQNVQDIIKRFEFRNQIDKLSEHDILGLLISKFTDSSVNLSNRPIYDAKGNLVQPALDNHTMGTVFEEVIRKFNEETNITDAGRHFTPRDIVELITDLAFVPVKGKIQSTTYRIYDGACGTGGMLTVAEGRMQEMAKEFGKNVSIHLYGQENSDETYAIARSDMLVKGEGVQANKDLITVQATRQIQTVSKPITFGKRF